MTPFGPRAGTASLPLLLVLSNVCCVEVKTVGCLVYIRAAAYLHTDLEIQSFNTARAVFEINIEDRADPGLPPSSPLYTQMGHDMCMLHACAAGGYRGVRVYVLFPSTFASVRPVRNSS